MSHVCRFVVCGWLIRLWAFPTDVIVMHVAFFFFGLRVGRVLVGPKRSGTAPHLDPIGTSAWNTLLRGRKRWVLFPPDTPKKWIKEKTYQVKGKEDDEPIDYFTNIVPRIRAAHPDLETYDFVQYPGTCDSDAAEVDANVWVLHVCHTVVPSHHGHSPVCVRACVRACVFVCACVCVWVWVDATGETIFVPSGWWHAVLNLDDTIAVTQNFCSRTNFERVWLECRKGARHGGVLRVWCGTRVVGVVFLRCVSYSVPHS